MIEMRQIDKEVGAEDARMTILKDITFSVTEGEFIAVMGPSGSGKSTLMNIIGFLDVATRGTYHFRNKDVSTLSENQLATYRSTEIGFVFQAFNLLPKTTVYENVKMPLMYHPRRTPEKEQTALVKRMIESVGLTARTNHLSNQLSGGEKQRVAIARALINDPALILADEPTGNLDSKSGVEIMKIIERLNHEGKTVVLITHEQTVAEHANRIVHIRDGSIESDTAVKNRRSASETEQIK